MKYFYTPYKINKFQNNYLNINISYGYKGTRDIFISFSCIDTFLRQQ